MVLIFTGNEQLDKELSKEIKDSRVVYYTDYILEEEDATVLIATIQNNKYNFKEFMYKVRSKNIRVVLLIENYKIKELKDALTLGIYDIITDPFTIEDVVKASHVTKPFSEVAIHIKNIMQIKD
ncbi:MAG: hypothetical protein Q4G09_00790 [Clostridia bacterium]|nr:hypothetical protein [Clostridia bacterium]